ncbi:MAG: FAD-dependent oxidoreductase [Phycisphaerae bacterium]|nr:FAD-dependent oxidoreductase [Phycisphaerae bacterium]
MTSPGPRAHPVAPVCVDLDVLVLGGGIAGLWTLDALDAHGYAAALVEPVGLGTGQTLAAQGIIHGGLKYTLRGLLTAAAESISAMPDRWRRALAGAESRGRDPDLRAVRVASPCTWLWRTESLASKVGLFGASIGLRTRPEEVERSARPAPLASVPGPVFRVAEPVLDTVSLVEAFRARHRPRLVHASVEAIERGERWTVTCGPQRLRPRAIVLAAGVGNAELRRRAGLAAPLLQRRALHMTLVRGDIPELHGHCVDGAKTRATITTHRASDGSRVWQVGGQLAEDGVSLDGAQLIAHAARELAAVLPGVDLGNAEWATYRVDRAERETGGGQRPDDAQCIVEGACITLWPTKLALAPRGADLVVAAIESMGVRAAGRAAEPITRDDAPAETPLGTPPWETAAWSPATRSAVR